MEPATAKPLTPRQAEVLAAIVRYTGFYQTPPTQRELAAELGISHVSAREAVLGLKRKGRITFKPHVARSIRVLGCRCPVCGHLVQG